MKLSQKTLVKFVKDAIEDRQHFFADEDRPSKMHMSFRVTPKIYDRGTLLAMLEWRSFAPSGMLWDDEQGSKSVEINLKGINSIESLIENIITNVKSSMKYPREISLTNYKY